MKFIIKETNNRDNKRSVLKYLSEEYSFIMEPSSLYEIDYYLNVNNINLTVVDKKVVDLNGFCPYGNWTAFNDDTPDYSEGSLEIVDELEPGFSYRINSYDWPIYINSATGWVCIGNPKAKKYAIEFLSGSVAILGDDGSLLALWLNPVGLPSLKNE